MGVQRTAMGWETKTIEWELPQPGDSGGCGQSCLSSQGKAVLCCQLLQIDHES